MAGSDSEEKGYIGTDGKQVKLKHTKTITSVPWYADKQRESVQTSKYQEKRDAYEDYDPETYKAVIQGFSKKKLPKKSKKMDKKSVEKPIYDHYSRTTQVPSARDRKDTAHYLRDLNPFGGELEFDQEYQLNRSKEGQNNTDQGSAGARGGAVSLHEATASSAAVEPAESRERFIRDDSK